MSSQLAIAELSVEARLRFERLANALARQPRPVQLVLNANQRILISLRGGGPRPVTLSIHAGILEHVQACEDLPQWVLRGGRRTSPAMRSALDAVGTLQRAVESRSVPRVNLDPLGGPVDLGALLESLRIRHFPHLSTPRVHWARRGRRGSHRHVRFGCYRTKPVATILINPRLNQPWVARAFLAFVVFHELCHHAQASNPVPGETPHSKRFRSMERQFPDYDRVLRWERENLDRFLSDWGQEGSATALSPDDCRSDRPHAITMPQAM